MSKSSLRKKVLCSLLAASVFGVMYNPGAEAKTITQNGEENTMTVGQGEEIVITAPGNIHQLIDAVQNANSIGMKVSAIEKNAVVGVVGGEGQLDSGLTGFLNGKVLNIVVKDEIDNIFAGATDKIFRIDSTGDENIVERTGNTSIIIGGQDGSSSPVVIGAVGGDLSVNTGLNGKVGVPLIPGMGFKVVAEETSITRTGNTNIIVNNGNLLGGVGGSAAIAAGNIKMEAGVLGLKVGADLTMQGKTTTTINGNVNVGIYGGSNVAGFAGGGLAMGMGGEAASTVNGAVNINIDSDVELMDGASGNSKFDGITAGITGGGAAVTTLGGKADTQVGTVNIKINDGLSAGIIGGGVAAAVDATGGAEVIMGGQLGNDDGTVTIDENNLAKLGFTLPKQITSVDITIDNAVYGGEATSVTGDTNITLTGTSSAAGIVGGGVAISSHTYTWKGDGTAAEDYNVNDSFGYSKATAESGKTTITINVDSSKMTGEQKSKVINTLKALKDTQDLSAVNVALKEIQDTGTVVGIVGGGVAVAQGSNRSNMEGTSGNWGENGQGAYSNVTNTGADINLVNGYAVGTFGGGMAVADNNAQADAETLGDININIGNGTEAVGVFGNGLAYFTGSQQTAEGKNANLAGSANVVAQNTAINVGVDFTDYTGTDRTTTVDGIIGGGVAIDDSQADKVNATVKTEGTATINVFDGAEVNVMTLDALDGLAGDPQTDSNKNLDMGNYLAAVKDAAGNVAIAGGGVAIGGGADAYVENAVININGGTVNGDILGGGIAVYGHEGTDGTSIGGSHVKNATINLAGGKVDGSVYAGSAASKHDYRSDEYEDAQATVENATINLQGTEVTGIISGAGYYIVSDDQNEKVAGEKVFDYSVDSTLNLIGENTLTAVAGESKISGFDTVSFTENSETILKPVEDQSGEIAGETVFIDGTMGGVDNKTTINVADSARLNLSNLANDKLNDYVIAKSYDDASELWGDDQLAYDRTEGFIVVDETKDADNNNIYKVTYKDMEQLTDDELDDAVNSAADSLGEYGDNVRNIIRGIMEDTDHDDTNKGAHDLITETFENGNQAEVEKCLYTSSMVGEDSGVTSNAISMAQDFADNALLRLSFTQDTVNTDKVGEAGGVWAKYLHNKHEIKGMNSSFGALNSSSDYDGVMVGAELAKKGNMQAGIAFAYGEGDGSGLTTKNDFDMWGISLYGNVKNDDINIISDLGFSKSSNDITSSVLNNEFNTDRDLNIFTMGVRAEKLYTNGNTQVVPYIGLRYMSVDADSYATTYKSGDAFSYDADRQNIWTLPLGVSLRNETVTDNGWRITPKVDLAYIWAFGDTDNDMTIDSGSGTDVLHYDVMDSGSWLASVGIDAGKGDWSYGLSYTLQKGSDAENNKWFVNVNYSF